MRSVVASLAILGAAKATSDFGNHHASPYFYSEINSMEYDAETDYQSQNVDDHSMENSSQVVDSLDAGGCFVSAQAIMCNGGGDPWYMNAALESEDEFSDDEDDDEDDGHSSMLSNASLRRTRALASGAPASNPGSPRSDASNSRSTSTTEATYIEGEIQLKRNPAMTRIAFDLCCNGSFSSGTLAKSCELLPWLR